MSDSNVATQKNLPSREEEMAGLFAHMVLQHSNMAMMMLGKVPHPESGKAVQDLDSARLFIDQLEMLEAKTKGNLSKDEQNLLKQSLMTLRLAFVEVAENTSKAADSSSQSTPSTSTQTESATPLETAPAPVEESHKKFTKKY